MKTGKKTSHEGIGAFLLCLLFLGAYAGPRAWARDDTLLEDRRRLLEVVESGSADAVPALKQALADERELMNLTAVHVAVSLGERALGALEKALEHPDVEVRRTAIHGLARMDQLTDFWATILMDEHPVIRREVQLKLLKEHPLPKGQAWERLLADMAELYAGAPAPRRRHVVALFSAFERLTPQSRRVLILATEDPDDTIRRTAFEGILEHVERDWKEADELISAAQSDPLEAIRDIGLELQWKLLEVTQVRLPREGWRFKTDPQDLGREGEWYAPEHDDGDWRDDVPIESSWKNHVEDDYDGAAWYRRTFDVPTLPDWDRAYLHFEGVDEQAWVWLNGQFVGSHELGREGWNVPFVLDVAEALKPGQENQLAVRAANTSGGAGIWRPVRLRVLDSTVIEGGTEDP